MTEVRIPTPEEHRQEVEEQFWNHLDGSLTDAVALAMCPLAQCLKAVGIAGSKYEEALEGMMELTSKPLRKIASAVVDDEFGYPEIEHKHFRYGSGGEEGRVRRYDGDKPQS